MSKNESTERSIGRLLIGSREGPNENSISVPTNTTMTTGKPRPTSSNSEE